MIKTFQKSVIVILVAALISPVILTKEAEAQFVVEFGPAATSLVSGILAATVSTAATTGPVGVGATTVSTARATIGATCFATLTALDTADIATVLSDTTSSAALSVIGGDSFELTKISGKIAAATTAKGCVDTYLEVLSAIPGVTLETSSELFREQEKYTKISSSLRTQIQDLSEQQSASVKDVMRAFMVKLVLNLNKNLTTNLVNNLMDKYKINDYLAYGDALATQVYAMKYIDQNYTGDARTQMMMRSLIQSPKAPEKARIAANFANQQAREFIASSCGSAGALDSSNRTSLDCLAAYGNVEASPMFKYMNALDTANQIQAQANQTAQAEIAQSNGYAPPRDCSGSLSQQQQLDSQLQAVSAERDAAEAVLVRLQQALAQGQTTQAEVDRAEAAFFAADTKLVELPQEVNSPIIDICKAIDSPGSFVGNSIQKFLDQHIDQTSQLKSDNLPFYASFLSDVAGNFLTNLLTGGKSTSQIFKEAGVQALGGGIASLPSILSSGNNSSGGPLTSQGLSEGDVQIYARSASGNDRTNVLVGGQPYVLVIDFSGLIARPGTNEDPVFNPVRTVISGGNFAGS
ncbi:MAG TPA: hypothetical protein PKD34_00110, partial [Candidatus Doudnabacteria bacterium]|nr:hypothetical protein [Candidatus Doudnabacteria bacterium]